jgi:uncharacterized membrane protein required for colicin V production
VRVSLVDALLALLFVPFAWNGWRRGLCREGFDLVGLLGGLIVAAATAPAGTLWLVAQGTPKLAAFPIALSGALVATMLVAHVAGAFVARGVHAIGLDEIDRGAGVLFGAIKGAACLGLVLMLLDRLVPTPAMQMAIQGSVLGPHLMRVALGALEFGRGVGGGGI